MLNITELERQWLRYKIKKVLPLIVGSLFIVILTITIILYTTNKEPVVVSKPKDKHVIEIAHTTTTKKVAPVQSQPVLKIPTQKPAIHEQPYHQTQEKEVLLLQPSMQFIHGFEEKSLPTEIEPQAFPQHSQTAVQTIPQQTTVPVAQQSVSVTSIQESPIPKTNKPDAVIESKNPSSVTITEQTSNSEVQDVIKRFKKNKNPALSLFIAKYYYDNKQYDQSYNYALMTNQIDSNIEESWLIFAKSLVKLDQKEMAITTLTSYIEYSSSNNARQLLQKIKQGSFK